MRVAIHFRCSRGPQTQPTELLPIPPCTVREVVRIWTNGRGDLRDICTIAISTYGGEKMCRSRAAYGEVVFAPVLPEHSVEFSDFGYRLGDLEPVPPPVYVI